MRRLWHENMPHSSTFLNNCRVYAAGSMDETLPMFYDGSMQNIKEHTADFDVADFEPEANEHSCPPCAVGPSLHGDRVGERAAGHAGERAGDRAAGMLTIVATVKLLVASRAKLDAMPGPTKKAMLKIEQGDVLEAAPTIARKSGRRG